MNYLSRACELQKVANEIYGEYEDATSEKLRMSLYEISQKYHQDCMLYALLSIACDLNRIANALEQKSSGDRA